MWFGFDWPSKVAVVIIMTFFPMLVNTVQGLAAADRMQRDLMRTYASGYSPTLRKLQLHLLPATLTAFPGLNGSSVPLGIFFVYGGVIFSMLTAVIYSIKGGVAIKQAIAHPEDEDIDFLNPEIED